VTLVGTALRYEVSSRVIISDVDVEAAAGRLLAVRGPSGSGKSSLLALLAAMVRPTAGTLTLAGQPLRVDDFGARRRVAVILQGYGLVTALSGWENVSVPLQARGFGRADVRRRTAAALAEVGLTPVADHLIEDLSGGQQQRVAVARALAADPEVLLADEPTAELDADNRTRIVDSLVARARAGAVVVIASHDPEVVERCDDVLTLEGGAVVAMAR
jgi:putative ABC transport system ATP-binding protein